MTANNIYQTLASAQKLHHDIKIFTKLENNDFFEYPFEFSLENKDLIDRVVDGKGSKQDIKTILNKLLSI